MGAEGATRPGWAWWVAAALAGVLAWRLRGVLTPFLLALVVAYLLEPVVSLLERRQVPRGAAILVTYLALGLVFAAIWVSVVPALLGEVEGLARRLPGQMQQWQGALDELIRRARPAELPEAARRAVEAGLTRLELLVERVAGRAAELVVSSVSQLLNLVLTPVLAYYILKDREKLAGGVLRLFANPTRERLVEWALEADRAMAAVIRGQLLVSATVGVVVAAGLVVLRVPYALVLGLLTALLDIIPYFGPVAAGIPIIGLALTVSPLTAVWALGLLVAANQVESTLLQPRLMSHSAGLHPLVVIAAVLAGAELGGVIGMLAAVPVAAVARSTLRVWLAWRQAPPGVGPAGSRRH